MLREGESVNGLLRNKIQVIQAVKGYRVSEDAVILMRFAAPRPGELILDAGSGCGAIAFGLAVAEPTATVVGLEVQETLCNRAARGARLNKLASRVFIVRGDLRVADRFFRPGLFDAVVCNPPYHEAGKGLTNPLAEKALARHQLMMPVGELFRVSALLLKPGGRIALIYPGSRADYLKEIVKETGFDPSRMLWIHPRMGTGASLLCLEAGRSGERKGFSEDALFLYDSANARTKEAQAILEGEELWPVTAGSQRCGEDNGG